MTRHTFHVVRGSNLYHEWMALSPEGYKIAAGDSLAAVLPAVFRYAAESLPGSPLSDDDWHVEKHAHGSRVSLLPGVCRGIVAEAAPGQGNPAYLEGVMA